MHSEVFRVKGHCVGNSNIPKKISFTYRENDKTNVAKY